MQPQNTSFQRVTLVLSPAASMTRSRSNVDMLSSKSLAFKEAGRLREVDEVRGLLGEAKNWE